MDDSNKEGHIVFKREGFNLFWNENGLEIQTTDYHVGCFQLSWETIFDLAQRAGAWSDCMPSSLSSTE